MDIAIVDCRANNKTVYSLENVGLTVIPTVRLDCLYDAVASHADMQIHYLGNNRFICTPQAFEHYKKYLPCEFELICGSKMLEEKYPYDIAYNTAVLDKYIICNSKYTAPEILKTYTNMSKGILNVKQGYAKCNVCIVNGSAIITSDKGIAKIATEKGIDVLEITSGHINLRNLDYGFIGGATGLINENVLAVNGDINTHPDAEKIKQFCKDHKIEILSLTDCVLEDIGTIISVYM